MVPTREEIRSWLERGKKIKATHLIVVCDTFDYDDYPVYVTKEEDVREVYSKYNDKNMQMVMEVYSFRRSLEDQLKEHRAFHYD